MNLYLKLSSKSSRFVSSLKTGLKTSDPMKRFYLTLIVLLSLVYIAPKASSQTWSKESSLEFGVMFGGSNYAGDLTNTFFESRGTHNNFGLVVRYNPVQRFSFRLGANYGKISGDDRWYSDDEIRSTRNLHFQSDLWDVSAVFDINLNMGNTAQ